MTKKKTGVETQKYNNDFLSSQWQPAGGAIDQRCLASSCYASNPIKMSLFERDNGKGKGLNTKNRRRNWLHLDTKLEYLTTRTQQPKWNKDITCCHGKAMMQIRKWCWIGKLMIWIYMDALMPNTEYNRFDVRHLLESIPPRIPHRDFPKEPYPDIDQERYADLDSDEESLFDMSEDERDARVGKFKLSAACYHLVTQRFRWETEEKTATRRSDQCFQVWLRRQFTKWSPKKTRCTVQDGSWHALGKIQSLTWSWTMDYIDHKDPIARYPRTSRHYCFYSKSSSGICQSKAFRDQNAGTSRQQSSLCVSQSKTSTLSILQTHHLAFILWPWCLWRQQ